LDLMANTCLVVEDAQAGIEAAIAGNMESAAVGDARICKKATYHMNAFSELLRICI